MGLSPPTTTGRTRILITGCNDLTEVCRERGSILVAWPQGLNAQSPKEVPTDKAFWPHLPVRQQTGYQLRLLSPVSGEYSLAGRYQVPVSV